MMSAASNEWSGRFAASVFICEAASPEAANSSDGSTWLLGLLCLVLGLDQVVVGEHFLGLEQVRGIEHQPQHVPADLDGVVGLQLHHAAELGPVDQRAVAAVQVAKVVLAGDVLQRRMRTAGAVVDEHQAAGVGSADRDPLGIDQILPCDGPVVDLKICSRHVSCSVATGIAHWTGELEGQTTQWRHENSAGVDSGFEVGNTPPVVQATG